MVYASILTCKRSELHGRIGTAIEEIHKDDLAEHCEILCEHFCQSSNYDKAARDAKRVARNGMRFHLGVDYALYGEFFKR